MEGTETTLDVDLYAPRETKGSGVGKHGLCPICAEEGESACDENGWKGKGPGKKVWLGMKVSAFKW